MRPHLQALHDKGYDVVLIDVGDNLKPNRWIYCTEALTLFCDPDVARDALVLWPGARVASAQSVVQVQDRRGMNLRRGTP